MVRVITSQGGALRLGRDRDLWRPLHARDGLCPAASLHRRSRRADGGVGVRSRRHRRGLPGDRRGCPRARCRDSNRRTGGAHPGRGQPIGGRRARRRYRITVARRGVECPPEDHVLRARRLEPAAVGFRPRDRPIQVALRYGQGQPGAGRTASVRRPRVGGFDDRGPVVHPALRLDGVPGTRLRRREVWTAVGGPVLGRRDPHGGRRFPGPQRQAADELLHAVRAGELVAGAASRRAGGLRRPGGGWVLAFRAQPQVSR